MRCEEIQERFVDLLYDESGGSAARPELLAHIGSCPACQKELEGLKEVRRSLKLWKDEKPIRSIVLSQDMKARQTKWRIAGQVLRYAAVAAMVLIAFLALANSQITWNKDGFLFTARLLSWNEPHTDYYTKAEVRDLLKKVLDDSELRINETNYMMMQRMLDTVEQDRWMDLRLIRSQSSRNQNKN